jgi:CheY-like chemotaxis protein
VESQVGEGSTFYFTLPIPPVEPEPGQITVPKSESGIALSVTKPPLTILAIDEDNQVIKLYERYLAKHGYQIIECNDPALALAKTRQFHPYAVLLDVAATHKTPPFGGQPSPEPDQPANNGWKALQDLKQDTVTRTIPVIICTLLDGAQNQEKGVRMGASAYLLKPILEDDLVISLDSIKESL